MSSQQTPVTHRSVWMLSAPIILSNISVPLVGAVDTAVVGHLPGPASIGAVALGALAFSFLYWGFSFLRMGTTGFVARAFGAGEQKEIRLVTGRVLLMAIAFGFGLIVIGRPAIDLVLLGIESSQTVENLTTQYAYIRLWSAPATLCIYVFTGILIGLHDTRSVFVLQLVLNLTNIFLDLIFVLLLDWGVAGVAWATLIAEYLAVLCGLILLRPLLQQTVTKTSFSELCQWQPMKELMRANTHILVRTLCLVFSFALFTAQGAKLGEVILAANAILLHLQSIMAHALDGFASAVEALAGSAYGANDRKRFKKAVRLTTIWATITAAAIGLVYLMMGEQILSLFSNQNSVLATAIVFLPWMIISPIISVWSFQLDGIFIGTGHTRAMQNAMLVSTAVYLLLLFVFTPQYGNHGLYLSLTLFMLMRAISLQYYYPGIVKELSD